MTIKNMKTTNNNSVSSCLQLQFASDKLFIECFIYSPLLPDTGPWVFALCAIYACFHNCNLIIVVILSIVVILNIKFLVIWTCVHNDFCLVKCTNGTFNEKKKQINRGIGGNNGQLYNLVVYIKKLNLQNHCANVGMSTIPLNHFNRVGGSSQNRILSR